MKKNERLEPFFDNDFERIIPMEINEKNIIPMEVDDSKVVPMMYNPNSQIFKE